ncbi:MAG: SPOR domain-containing protein [Novosphingobium sp.]
MIKRLMLLSALTSGILLGGPASAAEADVKAGVDAWARGDYPTAVREWGGPASDGDADAQFNLAQAYKLGRGVPQDLGKAEKWFGKAAAQGHVQASDNYGLLLFDRGEHAAAMPYIKTAADRADPRAQYLLGIAHFNGDLVAKDWVRAYALMSLARSAGLPQATPAMTQMDGYIPLTQRQQAAGLAQQLAAEAEANRSRQLASADLGADLGSGAINPAATPGAPPIVAAAPTAPQARRTPPTAEEAVAMAERASSGASPRNAGADYARPAVAPPAVPAVAASPKLMPPVAVIPTAPKPAPKPALKPAQKPTLAVVAVQPKPVPAPVAVAAIPARAATADATWRIQFGAFGVASNADALWAKLRSRPELSGHPRINVPVGSPIRSAVKLQAGQFTHDSAQAACAKLSAAGFTCIAVRN